MKGYLKRLHGLKPATLILESRKLKLQPLPGGSLQTPNRGC